MARAIKIVSLLAIVGLLLLIFYPKGKRHLRGSTEASKNGKTYLVIVDDNASACHEIKIDGKVWPHKKNEAGLISPGIHKIECGGEIEFEIPSGVIFYFNYWGP